MMFWAKRWACHFFDLVDRKDHVLVWERRRQAEERFSSLVNSFESLSNNFTRMSLELERERSINRQLVLDRAITNTAPLESMDRALSALLNGNYPGAMDELENGLKLMKDSGKGMDKWKLAF